MAMNRRKFLKGFGQAAAMIGIAAVVPSAIVPVAQAFTGSGQGATRPGSDANAYQQLHRISVENINTEPLVEGVPPEPLNVTFYRDYPEYPPTKFTLDPRITNIRWSIEAPNIPSARDPLGQFGYVALKYDYNGNSYGDWLKISDDFIGDEFKSITKEVQAALVQVANMKIRRIDAQQLALSKLKRVAVNDTMRVGHINQFVDYLQEVA